MGNAGYIIDMTSDTRFVPHGKKTALRTQTVMKMVTFNHTHIHLLM